MKLSVVIVNYNVKYFLLQLLQSIQRSDTDFDYEVIVVDNASSDGSDKLIPGRYPWVKYIQNQENVGFSKANNQAIRASSGEYVLLLNPDTILQERTLQDTVNFLDQHPDAGAVGCRMIDGSGHFLPESKRGFPTPVVAFFKAFGFSSLFPRSRIFNRYYLGHLDEYDTNRVDVLTGAFMLMRKSVLDEIGYLDERFFMYGEDIDLSYRIAQSGYHIYYYPQTTIIHFKGESTKKDTISYIRTFYRAMKDFARKHYSGKRASLLGAILNVAIYFRAGLAVARNLAHRFGLWLVEYVLIWVVLFVFSHFWADWYYGDADYYKTAFLRTNITIYAAIWTSSLYLLGAYDRVFYWGRLLRGVAVGWLVIAALYGFFGPTMRPSRALVLVGGLLTLGVLLFVRLVLFRIQQGHWRWLAEDQKKYLIVGDAGEAERVRKLVALNHPAYHYAGQVAMSDEMQEATIGHISQLDQIARFYGVNEIIFCSVNLDSSSIMQWMTRLGQQYTYKMAPDPSYSIIGSRSKDLPGELYTYDIQYQIDDPFHRRNKRFLDVALALLFLLFSWLIIWWMPSPQAFLHQTFLVLSGKRTWVSYSTDNEDEIFPQLPPGVLIPVMAAFYDQVDLLKDTDFYYARDYTPWQDLKIIFSNFRKLGTKQS